MLDLEEKDLPGVAYRVVEQMVIEEFIEESDKATVMRALLLRHRHVNEHDRFRFAMKRNFSSYTSLQVRFFLFVKSFRRSPLLFSNVSVFHFYSRPLLLSFVSFSSPLQKETKLIATPSVN